MVCVPTVGESVTLQLEVAPSAVAASVQLEAASPALPLFTLSEPLGAALGTLAEFDTVIVQVEVEPVATAAGAQTTFVEEGPAAIVDVVVAGLVLKPMSPW